MSYSQNQNPFQSPTLQSTSNIIPSPTPTQSSSNPSSSGPEKTKFILQTQTEDEKEESRMRDLIQFINDKAKLSIAENLEELKLLLKKKFLSVQSLEEEKKKIASKIFYFPSRDLVFALEAYGYNPDQTIYKSIAMNHGGLQMLVEQIKEKSNSISPVEGEINHVKESVISWGTFFFDVNKLEKISTQKSEEGKKKIYELGLYEMKVELSLKNANSASVKYKGKTINQQEFKENVLEEIAEKRLRDEATRIYYEYLKQYQT